jgi:hypothetical protein
MKKLLWVLAGIVLVATTTSSRSELEFETDFVLNARPASVLIEAENDKFAVTEDGRRTTISSVYAMPNVSAGVGLDFDRLYVDLTGGGGILINDTFRSFLLQAGVTASFRATDSFKIGPRLAVVHFPNPEWLDDDDTEFDGTTGYLLGVQAAMGDKISYILSLDVISADFDVDSVNELEQDELELTGLAFQFGVRGEF